jgi:hypothetical protein
MEDISFKFGTKMGRENIKNSTNNLLTSQSVFCFPMGIDSYEKNKDSLKNGDQVK